MNVEPSSIFDLLDISVDESSESDCLLDVFDNTSTTNGLNSASTSNSGLLAFDILKKIQGASSNLTESTKKGVLNKQQKITDKKNSAWMELFADLDPLANPTNMEKKIAGTNSNCLDA